MPCRCISAHPWHAGSVFVRCTLAICGACMLCGGQTRDALGCVPFVRGFTDRQGEDNRSLLSMSVSGSIAPYMYDARDIGLIKWGWLLARLVVSQSGVHERVAAYAVTLTPWPLCTHTHTHTCIRQTNHPSSHRSISSANPKTSQLSTADQHTHTPTANQHTAHKCTHCTQTNMSKIRLMREWTASQPAV